MSDDKRITIAILGNPNTGTTSLFNQLTGLHGSVGNYPRVTVGIRKHSFEYQGWEIQLVDLPGIYSLSCRTDEERESRNFLYHEAPDLILNILDMSNLERNLLLTSQLIEMSIPRITVLNMVDEAEDKGVQLDEETFAYLLNTPVVETNARDGVGVDSLLKAIMEFAEAKSQPEIIKLNYDSHLEEAIERTQDHIARLHDDSMRAEHSRWLAIKLLENDETVIKEEGDHTDLIAAVAVERDELKKGHSEDAAMLLNNGRYGFVNGLLQETMQVDVDTAINRIDATRVIDAFLLHKWLGMPIFLFIMWVMFESTFTLGAYPVDWIDAGVGLVSDGLNNIMPDNMFKDLLINGVLAGVGGTIIFLPNIVILFFFIAVFNDTGYMVRGAVLVDRIMHKFGLHGKAFIPMLTGFGCNVPAIMATRTIEHRRDRLVAILVNPFISCSARLPVFILFTGAFFGENAKLIDLKSSFVMPGMMDMHVHMGFEIGANTEKDMVKLEDTERVLRSAVYAKRILHAGFTTVRDLGGKPEISFALRNSIAKGWVAGPRIIASGSGVAATGGHGDVDGMKMDLLKKETSETVCDGVEDCRRAVRHAVKYGADVIKITATGGVLSETNTGTGQQMTDDEMKEIMDTAHNLGRKIAAHAHAAEGINAALRAGVDSIEHGSYADKTSIKLFKKTGAYLVPTLLAGNTVVKMAETTDILPPVIAKKAIRVGGDMMAHFSVAYKKGVKIAFGTDSGVSAHGINAEEAVLMHQAGMSEMDILKSATVNAADLADMSDSLGTLEVGKQADIIAMDASPLKDIKEVLSVDFVMKGGTVHKQ